MAKQTQAVLFLLVLTSPFILSAAPSVQINSGSHPSISSFRKLKIGSATLNRRYASRPKSPGIPSGRPKKGAPSLQGLDPAFRLREVYVFPNPVRPGQVPTVHVETGLADRVELRFYDAAGEFLFRAEMKGAPSILNDGQGPEYAYEYAVDPTLPSGAYWCSVESHRDGEPILKRIVKWAVLR